MIKKCKVCGKEFTPAARHERVQQICSDECRTKNWCNLAKEPENLKKMRDRQRQKSFTICRICGKQIIRNYDLDRNASTSRLHDECVFEDCRKTILAGKTISHAQQLRLYARGYTIKEFKAEMNEETHE